MVHFLKPFWKPSKDFRRNHTIGNQFGRWTETAVWRTVWRHSRIHIHHVGLYNAAALCSKALFIPFDFFSRYFPIRFTDFVPFILPPSSRLARHVLTTTLRRPVVLKLFGTISSLLLLWFPLVESCFFFSITIWYSLFTVKQFLFQKVIRSNPSSDLYKLVCIFSFITIWCALFQCFLNV